MKTTIALDFRRMTLLLCAVLFTVFMYTFLHEAGHAAVGTLFGQSVTEFDVKFWVLQAHVGLVGGTLTNLQQALRSAAGASLPLMVWAVFMALVPQRGSHALEALKLAALLVVINTLLPWIAIPVLFMFGRAPSDDVTSFLLFSKIPPLFLAGIAGLLYAGGWILFRARITSARDLVQFWRAANQDKDAAGTRTVVAVMASLVMICVGLTAIINGQARKNTVDKFAPPQDFALATQIDLAARPYPGEPVWQFTLDKPAYVGVFIVVSDINTTYFDLSIAGPKGFHSTILHGEGYRANRDGGLWEKSLPGGTYQLMLTSDSSPGIAAVYLAMR